MDDAESVVALPASWYPDPDDGGVLRWWDGAAWTEHVQSLPAPPSETRSAHQPAPETKLESITDAFVIKTHIPEAGTWYAETGNRYVPRTTNSSLPAAERDANDDFDKDDPTRSRWTVQSWLLALLPVIAFGIEYLLTRLGNGGLFASNPLFFWIVPALFVVANLILATMDRGALASRNIRTAPSGLIGILPPVYFLLRAITVGPSSIPPLVVWCVGVAAIYGPMQVLVTGFFSLVAAH
ncbi:hypothetical protein BH11ACT2_BH11ACT2_01240 [soil metagenome]